MINIIIRKNYKSDRKFHFLFQLAYCVVQFLEKDASLTEDVSLSYLYEIY